MLLQLWLSSTNTKRNAHIPCTYVCTTNTDWSESPWSSMWHNFVGSILGYFTWLDYCSPSLVLIVGYKYDWKLSCSTVYRVSVTNTAGIYVNWCIYTNMLYYLFGRVFSVTANYIPYRQNDTNGFHLLYTRFISMHFTDSQLLFITSWIQLNWIKAREIVIIATSIGILRISSLFNQSKSYELLS